MDLTDEMQYYGQIKGLIESGKLFSNDLFIQQLVYILFYPVFYLYHLVFDFEGLVFFGRILMSLISISLFLYAYQKLKSFKFPDTIAGLTALSMVFAVPYHGIFAPSYNTISQVLWIVFTLRFFEWKRSGAISWGIFPIIMFFAHQPSAVAITLLVLVRLLVERKFKQIGRLFLVFSGCVIIVIPIMLYFATPQEYLASITFSSGYGVGTNLFSGKGQYKVLIIIYGLFFSSLFFSRRLSAKYLALLTFTGLVITIILFSAGLFHYECPWWVVYALPYLSALAYCWALSHWFAVEIKSWERIHWLAVLLLLFATTLALTSSNGITQSRGAFMVGLPLLLGFAATRAPNKEITGYRFLKNSCVILLLALFVVHWISFPYQEARWWHTNYPLKSVPEFRLIKTSLERSEFINRMQQLLGPFANNKKALIVGRIPALYFALDASAETCMFCMHSIKSERSEKVLLTCLDKKSPEIVIDFSSEGSRINSVMKEYCNSKKLSCVVDTIEFPLNSNLTPNQLSFSVCKPTI
ncbi:hypothetical protein ACFL0H_04550 [Thermodesulfobacteriota bacterium]